MIPGLWIAPRLQFLLDPERVAECVKALAALGCSDPETAWGDVERKLGVKSGRTLRQALCTPAFDASKCTFLDDLSSGLIDAGPSPRITYPEDVVDGRELPSEPSQGHSIEPEHLFEWYSSPLRKQPLNEGLLGELRKEMPWMFLAREVRTQLFSRLQIPYLDDLSDIDGALAAVAILRSRRTANEDSSETRGASFVIPGTSSEEEMFVHRLLPFLQTNHKRSIGARRLFNLAVRYWAGDGGSAEHLRPDDNADQAKRRVREARSRSGTLSPARLIPLEELAIEVPPSLAKPVVSASWPAGVWPESVDGTMKIAECESLETDRLLAWTHANLAELSRSARMQALWFIISGGDVENVATEDHTQSTPGLPDMIPEVTHQRSPGA